MVQCSNHLVSDFCLSDLKSREIYASSEYPKAFASRS